MAKQPFSETTAKISAGLMMFGLSVSAPGNMPLLVRTIGSVVSLFAGIIADDRPSPATVRADIQKLLKTIRKAMRDAQLQKEPKLLEICKELEEFLVQCEEFFKEERSVHDRQDIRDSLAKIKESLHALGVQA